jgi:hypothetical protein
METTIMNLASVWTFLSAHAVVILLAWPLFTALVNLAFGAAEKWALAHPKFAAVLGVLESAGFNARGVIAWLAKALAGKTGVIVQASKKVPPALVIVFVFGAAAGASISRDPMTHVMRDHIVDITSFVESPLAMQGCNATSAQIQKTFNDGVSAASCIISKVLTGIIDVAGLLTCSGATVQVIIDAVDDFEAQPADGGTVPAADINVAVIAQQRMWLDAAKQNAMVALAKMSSSP